jgi:hypothetical protein
MVAAQPIDTPPARFMTWFALVVVLATDVAYLLLIKAQNAPGVPSPSIVPFIAAYLVVIAVLLAASLMRRLGPALRFPLRTAAAAGLLVLGILALFSIGLPLVVAGAMATGATVRTLRGPLLASSSLFAVGAAVIAVVVLITGFEVTERMIVCPAQGSSGGGGTGFVTGPYYYDCVNGRLSFHSGSCNSTSIDANGNVTHPGC